MVDLDLDEMFHLAMLASRNGDHERAIILLKKGAEIEKSARFYYLLGAEHAEIGMTRRAVTDIELALEIDPNIADAWFQVGMLYAILDDRAGAINSWAKLDGFDDYPHLIKFKNAVLSYFSGDSGSAISLMHEGLELNAVNEALNHDMNKLLERWSSEISDHRQDIDEDQSSSEHLYLSAYTDKH